MRVALFMAGSMAFMATGIFAGFAAIILSAIPTLGLMALGVSLSFFVLAIFCAMRAER